MYTPCHLGPAQARIVVLGRGPLSQVQLHHSGHRLQLDAERQRLTDQACERLRQRGQIVTADPIYRVESWHTGEQFALRVGLGDYAQVVGTKAHPEWDLKSNVLALCCILQCPDGIILERRSQKVAALPGAWHVAPAGSLSPPNTPYQTLLAEAHEEMALEPVELFDLQCLGMCYGEDSGVYQLICSAQTPVPLAQILSRPRSGAWEQDGLLCAPSEPQALDNWIQEHGQRLTPAAQSALWVRLNPQA